jgi:thiol-disulfide isomerase/thioredoxin
MSAHAVARPSTIRLRSALVPRALARAAALVCTLAFLTAVAGARRANAQEGGIAVGTAAPGAAVFTLDGKPVDLAQYVGKTPVVLEFWATWCPLCKKLEPAMAAARREYAGRVTFISVGVPNNQTPERQRAYADEKQLGGEFVFDRDSKAVAAYKVPHTSYVVVLDKAGKVVYTGVGGEQDVAAAVARALDPMGGATR